MRNGQTYATIERSNFGTPFAKDESYPVWIGGIKLPKDMIVGGIQIQFSVYYVTQDNIKVTGIKTRALQFAEGEPTTFTGWTSNGGNTITGIITQEAPEHTDMEPSEGNTNGVTTMATRSMLTIAAPADTISYTISKVYDSETETQTVEGGNQVGKISYTEKPGYVFAGWYQDKTLTVPADFSNVQADMTVYARYISSSDISLSFSRKNVSDANVVFNVTVGVKNIGDFKEVNIICSKDGSETEDALTTKTTKKTGSGKNRKYTYCYKGTAALQDLSRGGTFVSTICWVTPDGTKVTGETYSCTYWLGFVVVQ